MTLVSIKLPHVYVDITDKDRSVQLVTLDQVYKLQTIRYEIICRHLPPQRHFFFFFFITLGLELSDTNVYEP